MKKYSPFLYLGIFLNIWVLSVQAQNSAEILQGIERLHSGNRILYIAAHPDDENTRLISWLSQAYKADVAYLSITRGSGGQNLIGPEIGDALGVIRTEELLAARRIDGGRQFFTRARDFGYSKSAAETLEKWGEERVLEDIVYVIRSYKPDMIITRFSPVENPQKPTHGHHTASAMLAMKAFDMANDPKAFPDQLKTLTCWKTSTLAWNTSTWFYGSPEKLEEALKSENRSFVKIDVSTFIPLMGESCTEIAAKSRSMHKSQGFGSSPATGEQYEYLEWLKGLPLKEGLEQIVPYPNQNSQYKAIRDDLEIISGKWNPFRPYDMGSGMALVYRDMVNKGDPALQAERIEKLIYAAHGIQIQVVSSTPYVSRGDSLRLRVEVRNPSPYPLSKFTIVLPGGYTHHIGEVAGKSHHKSNASVYIPENAAISEPYWLQMEHGESHYEHPSVLQEGEVVVMSPTGMADIRFELHKQAFQYEQNIEYTYTDPVEGEVRKPIGILPRASLAFDAPVYLSKTEGTVVNLMLTAHTNISKGFAEIILPKGWKADKTFYPVANLVKGQTYNFNFRILGTPESANGEIKAMLKEELLITTSTTHEINYAHIPAKFWFETCKSILLSKPVSVRAQKVAYIEGAGDAVAEAIKQMGCSVDVIHPNMAVQTDYTMYDAVVLGVRSYNTLDDIEKLLPALFDFVKGGGTVIVQYNTTGNLKTKLSGPAPFTIGRGRVTREDSPFEITLKDHASMSIPNPMIPEDFEGWVQERGLYFASVWDKAYEAPLSFTDPGEKPESGSLLIMSHGKGHFVYTGLSFFRQMPAGVHGSYKLMANLLSLSKTANQ